MRRTSLTVALIALAALLLALWLVMRADDPVASTAAAPIAPAPAVPAAEPQQLELAAAETPADSTATSPRVETVVAAPTPDELPQPAKRADLAELRGRFLLPDGRPATGVALEVRGWQANFERVIKHGLPNDWRNLDASTDDDGRFALAFDPPLAFQFTLSAKLADHASVSWRWSALPAREVTDVGEVTLQRAGGVRGRVVDAKGAPVPGDWRVYGESLAKGEFEGRDTTRVSALTDASTAEFALEGLPPGGVELKLHSRLANWINGPRITVRAGEDVMADIVYDGPDNSRRIVVVTFHKPFHVFSNPVSGSTVLRGTGEERVAEKIAGSSQSWSFEDLEPGAYDIEIRDPFFEPWIQRGVRTGTSVNANLRASGAVRLSVLDPQGRAVDDYRLRVWFPQERQSPDGSSYSFSPSEFELRQAGAPAPEGGLWRGMIPAGVALNSPLAGVEGFQGAQTRKSPSAFVLRVNVAGYATAEARVEALGVGETREVQVQLASAASVRGRIRGVPRELVEGVSVVLADAKVGVAGAEWYRPGLPSDERRSELHMETHSDADGHFSFDGVRAGSYVLVARFHRDFTVARDDLSVQAGETLEVDLQAAAFGAIEAQLVAPPSDLEHAWIEARARGRFDDDPDEWSISHGPPYPRTAVDADGRARLAPLRPATYRLTLHHSLTPLSGPGESWRTRFGGGQPLGEVTVVGAAVARSTFDLMALQRGSIHVQARVDGAPAVGWRVHAEFTSELDPSRLLRTSALVDADGFARLKQLEPGAWRVGILGEDRSWSSWTTAPSTLAPGDALTLRLDVDRIRGRVRVLDAQTGQPRAKTWIDWRHSGSSARVETDSSGELELLLPVGSYSAGRNTAPTTVEWTASGPVPAEIRL